MSDTYERWRAADREAHAAETLARQTGGPAGRARADSAELIRARDLRARADALFDAAMNELNREVNEAIRKRMARDDRFE